MSPKKQTSSAANARKQTRAISNTLFRRNTDFYAKSVHCKGNVVLKSANLTAAANVIDLTDVRDEDNDSNEDCVYVYSTKSNSFPTKRLHRRRRHHHHHHQQQQQSY